MSGIRLYNLVTETLTDPRASAQALTAIGVQRAVLWQGLVLVFVLNAIAFYISTLGQSPPSGIPEFLLAPLPVALMSIGGLALIGPMPVLNNGMPIGLEIGNV